MTTSESFTTTSTGFQHFTNARPYFRAIASKSFLQTRQDVPLMELLVKSAKLDITLILEPFQGYSRHIAILKILIVQSKRNPILKLFNDYSRQIAIFK